MYFVYILECADGTYYTGIAKNLEERIKTHNESPRGAKYTRSRRPVRLVYMERKREKGSALSREAELKKLTREQKREMISRVINRASGRTSRARSR